MHETASIISFTSDVLTRREEANKTAIHHETPLKAFFGGMFASLFFMILAVVVIGVVLSNYLDIPEGTHGPAYELGGYFGAFVGDYPFVLFVPLIASVFIAWKYNYKPTKSGIPKKNIVFLGKMTPELLDMWTRERSGKTFRPPQGQPLRIAYDFTFELAISPKAEVRYNFDEPTSSQKQTIEINVNHTHRHVHEYQDTDSQPKIGKQKRGLFGRKKPPLIEHHPIEKDDPSSRKAKLQALASDPNASPDERIAALNKLKEL